MKDVDLVATNIAGAKFDGVDLTSADLRSASLKNIQWNQIRSVKMANIAGVKDAPDRFVQWALQNGAVDSPSAGD